MSDLIMVRQIGVVRGGRGEIFEDQTLVTDSSQTEWESTMAVYRLVRFTIDPADTEKMLATRVALVAATRDAFPGLTEARLAKVDEETWIDMWRWDSLARAQAAIEGAPALPEAGVAFSLIKEATAHFAEIVDER